MRDTTSDVGLQSISTRGIEVPLSPGTTASWLETQQTLTHLPAKSPSKWFDIKTSTRVSNLYKYLLNQ